MNHYKGILRSIGTKNRPYKKNCGLKDPSKWNEIECKVKNRKNLLFRLTRTSKANDFSKCFIENELNLFKIWEGIRKIINISKKGSETVKSLISISLL